MLIPSSRLPITLAAGLVALAALAALSLASGSFPVAPRELASVLWAAFTGGASGVADNTRAVILEVRGPRIAAALAVGAALSAAGVVVAIGSLVRGRDRVLTLVLTGVVVGSLFSAGVAFAKALADPYNQLPSITYWLLGGLGGVLPRDVAAAVPLMLVALVPLALLRWQVNVLALPDDEARALGVEVARTRLVVIAAATLATAAAVAVAGVIGWVGLVVPHAARLLAGPSFARVLPLSALLGAAFLLAVDTMCRTVVPGELPPGVVTAIVGAPAFIALLAVTARRDA